MKCPKCQTNNPDDSKFCKECATPLPFSERPRISGTRTLETGPYELARGATFAGRYEIIEELGSGGMGKIYRAYDKKIEGEVALKVVRPEIAAEKKTVERFRNELKLAREISHRSVCRMYDLNEERGTYYITMEYVRGEDLKSFIKRAKIISTGTAVSIARQVAEGLREAHSLGVVHRDLKPGNIMIDREGNAKIMDFGIARAMRERGITRAGAIIGTPEYMSPEQVEGKEADQRADIYALGIILFEMVTGRAPFEGDTPLAVAHKQRYEPAPIPKKLVPQIPESLNRLILRCLEKDKDKRFQTADELLADLAAVEESLPTAERITPRRKTTTPREITVKLQPRRLVIPAVIIFILAIAAIFLWRFVLRKEVTASPSVKPTLAVLYLKNNSGDSTLDNWKENLPILLTAGLSQSRYLRVLDDPTVYGILKKLNLLSSERYTPEELRNIAAEGGATHVISGNYFTAGGKFIVNLSLIDAKTGTVLKPLEEEAPDKDGIYNSIDSLAKKIKSALNIPEQPIDEAVYKMVGEVYTRNPRALQYYIEAVRLDQNFEYNKAIKSLEKAVELDSEFAMAYRMLGDNYDHLGDYFKKYQYLTKAYQLKDKLPEKDRLVVEGSLYLLREETIPKAMDVLKKAVAKYPDDFLARYSLVDALSWGDIDLMIKELETLIYGQNQTKSKAAYSRLAGAYYAKGDYIKARECYETMANANPSDPDNHKELGWLFMLEKKFDTALAEFEKAVSLAPDDPYFKRVLARFYYLEDELEKSREILEGIRKVYKDDVDLDREFAALEMFEGKFREALSLEEENEKKEKDRGRTPLSMDSVLQFWGRVNLQTGHPIKALEKFREALEYVKKEEDRVQDIGFTNLAHSRRTCMIYQICALCDTGKVQEAEILGKEFERLVPSHQKRTAKKCFCYDTEFLEGRIALAKKNIPEAIRKLELGWQALRGGELNWTMRFILDTLADAYQLGGRLDKAAETYARIHELRTDSTDWGAVYARSYYKLGKIYEQMGKKPEAREEYRKFLDLWKNADPGLPEVSDAKTRLANLSVS